MKNHDKRGLGTFEGVFTPTILTILGVIMYLRLGWVVGNAGLWGALVIIVIAHLITFCTALSMASMLTNIEVEAGGAYAIISRSLGMEAGGAIGMPLYLSQAFSVAFYIIGFTELWQTLFPLHPAKLVSFLTWLFLTILSLISARLAFRIQYLILVAMALSIISFMAGPSHGNTGLVWTGNYQQASFWGTFAIFFPAVTGILTGASMSGELREPRRSIIRGTLAAIFTGFIIYVLLAYLFSQRTSQEVLLNDTLVILKLALYKPLIIAGILGATLSSALSTLVSAPRTLAALAEHRLIPFACFLAKKGVNNEPRNAVFISSLFSLAILLAGNLNMLAGLLTMFFLVTYGAINLAVFIEQVTGIVSFRPYLRISLLIPGIGFIGCILAMLLINKLFTVVALLVVIFFYLLLIQKRLVSPWGDVRGGIFIAITEWAAQKAMSMPYHPRLWKPSILVPIEKHEDFRRVARLLRNTIYPSGRLFCLTILDDEQNIDRNFLPMDDILGPLKKEGLFVQQITIREASFDSGLLIVLQTLLKTFLPPNTVFFTISNDLEKQKRLRYILQKVSSYQIGLMCLHIHPKYALGQERRINLWLREKSPNLNLAVLAALQLARNWKDSCLYLMRAIPNDAERGKAIADLESFREKARLPLSTKIQIVHGDFYDIISNEVSDITILGMPETLSQMFQLMNRVPGSILFVADSGLESATA